MSTDTKSGCEHRFCPECSEPIANRAEVERLRETLRIVAVAIPADWKNSSRGHVRRAYQAMSDFLIEDQRND